MTEFYGAPPTGVTDVEPPSCNIGIDGFLDQLLVPGKQNG